MVSPQERHTMVGVLLGTGDERSMAEVEGVERYRLSATDAWHGAVDDEAYVRQFRTVANQILDRGLRIWIGPKGPVSKKGQLVPASSEPRKIRNMKMDEDSRPLG